MYDIPGGFTNCNDNEQMDALKTSTFIEIIWEKYPTNAI